ncbi:hypothetical protein [Peterkaempfera sp. SMS 1(5)a]|uniref:hypothetical protein n=1 Tax=Peterkaempfera podocarpi TaxID=3232308 RepID=UPI003673241A
MTAPIRAEADVTDPASIAGAVSGHDAVVAAVKGLDQLVPRAAATGSAAAATRSTAPPGRARCQDRVKTAADDDKGV